jgi:hypothetical protein
MRALRASAALVLVLAFAGSAVPPCALACSCMPIGPLVDYVKDGNNAVMVGTVGGGLGEDRYTFSVERWYAGPAPAAIVTIAGGDPAMCGVPLAPGDRLVFAASLDAGVYHPSNCMPFAKVDDPQGAALIAEADRTLAGAPIDPTAEPTAGPQAPGPAPTPEATPIPAAPTSAVGPELVAGLAVLTGLGVLVVAALVARSRRAGA